jgi:hypothetical protein
MQILVEKKSPAPAPPEQVSRNVHEPEAESRAWNRSRHAAAQL